MRVAIDGRSLRAKLQGVGRHTLNLLLGLSMRESDLEYLVFYNDPVALKLVERSGGQYRGRFHWIKAVSTPGSLVERAEIPWLLGIHNADLFHDAGSTGLRIAGNRPVVITVHELAALHLDPEAKLHRLRRALRSARLVVAVSHSLSQEIEQAFNISRPKIRVIGNAIDPWYSERVTENETRAMRERFGLTGRYFLCVSADRPHKNLKLVREAAERWKGPETWVFTVPGADAGKLRYLGAVEDAWLRPLYAAAGALIAPSQYEGFSLPPVESLAVGAVPVVSDIPAHREALHEILPASLFFDPSSTAALEGALDAVGNGGDPMRASILEKFRLVRERYSCAETARLVEACYREALRG